MSEVVIRIEGQTWITLEEVSECYGCEVTWLHEACDLGLFGRPREYGGRLVVRVTVLDRVARVIRLSRYEGLGFEAIVVLLGRADDDADSGEPW